MNSVEVIHMAKLSLFSVLNSFQAEKSILIYASFIKHQILYSWNISLQQKILKSVFDISGCWISGKKSQIDWIIINFSHFNKMCFVCHILGNKMKRKSFAHYCISPIIIILALKYPKRLGNMANLWVLLKSVD